MATLDQIRDLTRRRSDAVRRGDQAEVERLTRELERARNEFDEEQARTGPTPEDRDRARRRDEMEDRRRANPPANPFMPTIPPQSGTIDQRAGLGQPLPPIGSPGIPPDLQRALQDLMAGRIAPNVAQALVADITGGSITQATQWLMGQVQQQGNNPRAADLLRLFGQTTGTPPRTTNPLAPGSPAMPTITFPGPGPGQTGQTPPQAGSPFPGTTPTELQQEDLTAGREGRGFLFGNFLDANPFVQAISPIARSAVRNLFNPLDALFQLQQAVNPNSGQGFTFRDFLAQQPGRPTESMFQSLLGQIQPLFTGQPANLSIEQAAARDALDRDASNILGQVAGAGVNPFLRPFAQQQVNRRIGAFQDQDLETPVFQRFFQGGLF